MEYGLSKLTLAGLALGNEFCLHISYVESLLLLPTIRKESCKYDEEGLR